MPRTRLRTRFLLSMVVITAGLTALSLLVVRHSVQKRVREGIVQDLRNSVTTFQNFQHDREGMLTHSAELVANLPITRAIMTAHDPATIQDASKDVWQLTGSDLLVLSNRNGDVVALHTKSTGFNRDAAQKYFERSLNEERPSYWWFGDHHLYQTFVQPVYFGAKTEGPLLGFLIIGYEIDDRLAHEISKVSASEVVFSYGDEIVATTLTPGQALEPGVRALAAAGSSQSAPHDVEVGNENFVTTSLDLSGERETPVRLTVLGSYDEAAKFLNNLNRLLLLLGLTAVLIGSGLVFLISHTFTRPLASLVEGVRALEHGDFHHPLDARGSDEVAELTSAFDRMRSSLLKTQQALLESEQLATIGRMASSISHDLRHALAAVVANSEFLCDGGLTSAQREELYQEVRTGVNQMTDLIDSLLEFARTRESMNPTYASVVETVQRAMQAVRLHPRHQGTLIEIKANGQNSAWFDPRKLERALYNLLLNACEAAPGSLGRVTVTVERAGSEVTIAVSDNGPGIAEEIRGKLFHPFVSFGKENGTGLGLTVVQKIVQDHGGKVLMERTSDACTVFRITIPGGGPHGYTEADDERTGDPFSPVNSDRMTENSIRHSDT
ncbi:MAG: periplasmic sensor signal transduction histidine kinase [Candidatus Sulfotelmatobacter sp.]|nr:periplasmic sensor signal transduction histidine kinase [Candidatus Sulfotelmatobacter sp.]